jgi:hypothetical protein
MIYNKICPYCGIKLIQAQNSDNSRSVEHLIPNAALTIKRKKDEGDFYACRKCNARKSHIDYILGVVAKAQMDCDEKAADTLINAVTKNDGASKRFINMVQGVKKQNGNALMTIPIKGSELLEYIFFLGKGQYFKENLVPFDPQKYVMKILFANKQVINHLKNSYFHRHNSDPMRDLEKNEHSEIINNGECIIYSQNNGYMFTFHDYTVITIEILSKSRKNYKIAQNSKTQILKDFSKST